MKRILIVSQNFYPELGSAANRMKNLFVQFEKKGYRVHILTTEPSYPNSNIYLDKKFFDDPFLNEKKDFEIIRLHMRHEKHKDSMKSRLLYYTEFMIKVHYFIKHSAHLFDYLYITSPNIFVPWGALFFQKKVKTNKILEIRDLWPDSVVAIDKMNIKPFMPILRKMEISMYKKADKIIVNNESFIEHIQKYVRNKPFLFIPNGMNESEVTLDQLYESFSVIYTGNIGFAQNLDQLEAIAQILNDEKIYFNVVAYGVNAKAFHQYVKDNNLKYVNVIPPMTRSECIKFTSRHHVSLSILKDTEIFLNVMPGKVVDAICTHVPIVTNLGGSTNRMINKHQVGYAVESATTHDLIEAILEYRDHPNLYKQHSKNAEDLKHKLFKWEKNIEKIDRFINEGI